MDAHDAADSSPRSVLPAVLIGLGCAALYFLTRSPALDEWDSVQFALGVGDFNLWRHQPHPPGYPLFIAAGWLFSHGLPLTVPDALALASALGGGMFVTCWFVLAARRFGPVTASFVSAALATLLIVWMSATKVLSDPLGTGLLALTLVYADGCRSLGHPGEGENSRLWQLGWMGLAGAAAVGVRPQNFGVVLLIVCLAVGACRAVPAVRRWSVGLGVFLAGNLLWLLPTGYLQARTPELPYGWLTYPRQLLFQWQWRLDQPKAFIAATTAAGAESASSLWLYRLGHHPLGWLTRGFGFAVDSVWGWLGIAVLATGWTLYARSCRLAGMAGRPAHGAFWREHAPWAVTYAAMVFCFLPGDQRYYLPIFPLLILPAMLGWQSAGDIRTGLPRWTGPWLAGVVPLATLGATLPFVWPNHTEPAPPVRMARWLQAQYPSAQHPQVWLALHDLRRHFDWYAPEFHELEIWQKNGASTQALPWPPADVRAFYTDDPAYADGFFPAGAPSHRWELVREFDRSPLIYRKHSVARLYRLTNNPAAP